MTWVLDVNSDCDKPVSGKKSLECRNGNRHAELISCLWSQRFSNRAYLSSAQSLNPFIGLCRISSVVVEVWFYRETRYTFQQMFKDLHDPVVFSITNGSTQAHFIRS